MFDEFLPDIVSSEDLFKNKAHKAISEEIYKIITSENCDDGFPIGLVGEWGSGKSTIVNMLMKSLEEKEDYFVYYVDSWAHEGDQLRRSFLKKLITKTKKEYENKKYKKDKECKKHYKVYEEKLENLAKKNSNNITVTKSRHSITLGGVLVAFFAALVPIGAALVESVAEDVTFIWGGDPHPKFLAGSVLCAGFAFLLLIISAVITLWRKKHKKSKEKWRLDFIDEEETDFSQEEERSSVEFEEYFEEILNILKCMGKTDFVCVIDNIDRISCDRALEIWSTLQVFMKYKNPCLERNESLENVKNNDGKKRPFRIWTIIPYAESQIKKLWEKDNDNNINIAEHFFSKMFLLRIDVPELMLSDWKDFTESELEKKFSIFSPTNKKSIIKVLELVKGNSGDYPTPREIKNYLNQVAYLHSVFGKRVSIESICFFVHLRHFESLSIEDIRKSLVENELPDNKMNFFNKKEAFIDDLTMMIFRAPKKDEKYLLLAKPIASALESRDYQTLKTLEKNHGENFKNVLEQLLRRENSSATSWIYCLKKAKFHDADIRESLHNFAEINIEVLKSEIFTMDAATAKIIFKVLKMKNKVVLLKTYFNLFCENFKNASGDKNELLEKLAEIEKIFKYKPPYSLDYSELGLEGLKAVVKFNNKNIEEGKSKLHIEKYLNVPETADNDLYDALISEKWLVKELPGIARILALAANFVLEKSRDIIEGLFTSGSEYAELYLRCLYELSVKKYEKSDAFIFKDEYWNCVFSRNNKSRILEAVCLFFINYEIFKEDVPSLCDGIIQKLQGIFMVNNPLVFKENADFVYNRLEETKNLDVLEKTLENDKLELGWECLNMAVSKKKIKQIKSGIFQKRKSQLQMETMVAA